MTLPQHLHRQCTVISTCSRFSLRRWFYKPIPKRETLTLSYATLLVDQSVHFEGVTTSLCKFIHKYSCRQLKQSIDIKFLEDFRRISRESIYQCKWLLHIVCDPSPQNDRKTPLWIQRVPTLKISENLLYIMNTYSSSQEPLLLEHRDIHEAFALLWHHLMHRAFAMQKVIWRPEQCKPATRTARENEQCSREQHIG
jgi:hypothetical protein